ncbi:C40 family peptidase [Trinickia symbiotica]|uniref:Hydrolase Nlp/P60 n=1 Tax=Trinickia symbiotica TaxID=863227 RepID=A0A2N7WM45_9BURK|nr:C40 family peptidase [Trinickia symbiotica]PMS30424.1 hydrolase Nlp/P60 [Trinickia symbiotica]
MRRLWFLVLVVLSLAACSSAPPRSARSGGSEAASGDALRTRPPGLPNFIDHSIGREEISIEAMSLVGVPYRWAGNTPTSGFDCSGLVQYVLARAADVKLPRTTADISQRGQSIEPDEIAPGDLVFFNTAGRPHSHVGIYVGKLRFVNAPSTGGTVRLDYLTNPYWARRFDGIRRVAPPLERPSPFDAPTYVASPRVTPAQPAADPTQAQPIVGQDVTASAGPAAANGGIGGSSATPSGPRDAIDAASDAFEPPPPAASMAERQAQQAGANSVAPQTTPSVQIMRASGVPLDVQPAPTSTSDDPIARFAAGAQ